MFCCCYSPYEAKTPACNNNKNQYSCPKPIPLDDPSRKEQIILHVEQ